MILQPSILIVLAGLSFANFGCENKPEIVTVIQRDTVLVSHAYIKEYNSGNSSELVSTVQVNIGSNWDKGAVVYSIKIAPLKKGDLIEILVDMEVTNDVTPKQNLYVLSQVILTDSALKLPDDPFTMEISEGNGCNVTPDMHHGHLVKAGTYQCPSDFNTDMYVNFCISAQSNTATPNDHLTVNQDYGRLSVLVYQ